IFFSYIVLITLFSNLHSWAGLIMNLYLCYSCLALGDLLNHIRPVIHSIENGDLNLAKKSMAKLVGREVQILDEKGLSRAAVETMSENFVDGFFSPLFWYLTGGILSFITNTHTVTTGMTLMLVFKVASTLDSMVGYKNERYIHFGRAGARLDDLMNFIPARLSIFILFLGAVFSSMHPIEGIKTASKDRLKHDSPNAAHAESFVAGALGIRLGGTTRYSYGIKKKPWIGNGTSRVGVLHMRQTTALIRHSAWIAVVTLLSPFLFYLV
ncbi:MAG: CobD/CbiB family cobalamin biosynthesis protein, partial [Thermodesulfobacteriota bacterium]|nr:CobD/CbiB family cobalamin biosynthesis protein [Thermodesulfobacteriota bacterium]